MKKIKILWLLFVLICACNKDNSNMIAKVADEIEGEYNLVSMQWDGNPVDINSDGKAGNDIYSAMMSLPTNSQNEFHAIVISMSQDRSAGAIGMQIPLQNVSVLGDGSMPAAFMIGNTLPLSLSYRIQEDGTIKIEKFESLGMSEFDSRMEMRRINTGTACFNMAGKLLFSVNYSLFDHVTGTLVDGIIHYEWEKL